MSTTINLTVMHAADGAITTMAVSKTEKLSVLHPAVTSAFSIPAAEQRFLFNNQPLRSDATLASVGIGDGDLVIVLRQEMSAPAAAPAGQPAMPASGNSNNTLSPMEQALISQVMNDSQIMEAIRNRHPDLAERLQRGDAAAGRQLLDYVRQIAFGGGLDMLGGAASAPSGMRPGLGPRPEMPAAVQDALDPMSVEGQKAIEERIRQENVEQNMQAALEHNPESFGRVVMLFVDCKINAVDGIKAFVDSGAQQTIISKECASRCGILHLMDTRFQGVARGVGTAKIHGRIHLALMTLGSSVFEITFTVMDAIGGGYDVLLGLDMLRKHAAVIDLSADCLRMGDVSVPFLSEKDIPLTMRDAAAEMEAEQKQIAEQQAASTAPAGSSSNSTVNASSSLANNSNTNHGSSANPSSSSNVSAKDVERIVELGFTKMEAEHALRMCDGNAEQAIATLASAKFDG